MGPVFDYASKIEIVEFGIPWLLDASKKMFTLVTDKITRLRNSMTT